MQYNIVNHSHLLCKRTPELSPPNSLTVAFDPSLSILPPSVASGNHYSTFCFYEITFFRLRLWVRSCCICLSVAGLFPLTCCPPGSSMLPAITGFRCSYLTSFWCSHTRHVFSLHSLADGRSGWVHILAIVNGAAGNELARISSR